jgi:hypothetical protein
MTTVQGHDSKYVRFNFLLPELQVIRFDASQGWNQNILSFVNEMPQLVKAVTLKFSLSNLNTRRKYSRMSVA